MGNKFTNLPEESKRKILEASKRGLTTQQLQKEKRREEYKKNPNRCLNCLIEFSFEKRKKKCCSQSCNAKFHNRKRIKHVDVDLLKEKINEGKTISELVEIFGLRKEKIYSYHLKIKRKEKFWTEEGRKILSDCAKERNLGGYRPHPNRGIWYKDIWLDSKYELKVAEELDANNIKWERPKVGFLWGDNKKYYPDFYLPEFDVYLDPKNDYLIKKDKEKIEQAQDRNGICVLVLDKNSLTWEVIKDRLIKN